MWALKETSKKIDSDPRAKQAGEGRPIGQLPSAPGVLVWAVGRGPRNGTTSCSIGFSTWESERPQNAPGASKDLYFSPAVLGTVLNVSS